MERGQNTIKRPDVWRVGEFPIRTRWRFRFALVPYLILMIFPSPPLSLSLSLSLYLPLCLTSYSYITKTINTYAQHQCCMTWQFPVSLQRTISPNMNNLALRVTVRFWWYILSDIRPGVSFKNSKAVDSLCVYCTQSHRYKSQRKIVNAELLYQPKLFLSTSP
jgi:hypothetical protein